MQELAQYPIQTLPRCGKHHTLLVQTFYSPQPGKLVRETAKVTPPPQAGLVFINENMCD